MGRPLKKDYFGPSTPGSKALTCEAWVNGDSQPRVGYIVKQGSSESYWVETAHGQGLCWLSNEVAEPGQMRIQVVADGFPMLYARKITDGEVYTWSGEFFPSWRPVNGQIVFSREFGTHWFAAYGDLSIDISEDYAEGAAMDSLGNTFICGARNVYVRAHAFITKLTPTGSIDWQRSIVSDVNTYAEVCMCDSSNNVFVAVFNQDTNDLTLIKMDTNADVLWFRTVVNFGIPTDIAVSSTDSVAVTSSGKVVAFESDGDLILDKTVEIGGNPTGAFSGVCWSGTNVVHTFSDNDDNLYAIAFNASAVVWSQKFTSPVNTYAYNEVMCDSDTAGNIFMQSSFWNDDYNYYLGFKTKLSSSGNVLWQKQVNDETTEDWYATFAVKSDDLGNTYTSGWDLRGVILTKTGPDGSDLWQRRITSDTEFNIYYNYGARDVAVQGNSVVVAGYGYYGVEGDYRDAVVANLPTDGSKTGTYGVFTYEEVNLPTDNSNWTVSVAGDLSIVDSSHVITNTGVVLESIPFEISVTNIS